MMSDLTLLMPLLLAIRIVLDLVCIANGRTPYQLEFAYFAVFAAGASVLLIKDVMDGWAWLAAAIATYSFAMFVYKRARDRNKSPESVT